LPGLLSTIRGLDYSVFTVCSLCGGVLTLISVPCTRKAGVCPRTNRVPGRLPGGYRAGVAQLVEHLICNQRVGGSNPFASSTIWKRERETEAARVDRRGQDFERRGFDSAANPLQAKCREVPEIDRRLRRARKMDERRVGWSFRRRVFCAGADGHRWPSG
jgi:hypothetical protein